MTAGLWITVDYDMAGHSTLQFCLITAFYIPSKWGKNARSLFGRRVKYALKNRFANFDIVWYYCSDVVIVMHSAILWC